MRCSFRFLDWQYERLLKIIENSIGTNPAWPLPTPKYRRMVEKFLTVISVSYLIFKASMVGQGFVTYLMNAFLTHPDSFFRAVPAYEGIFGRLAFFKSDFFRLGGYDESLKHGWGWEDVDIIYRAKAFGLREMFIEDLAFLRFISHDDRERVKHTLCKHREDSLAKHRKMSAESIARGSLVANRGLPWGSGKVIRNFEHMICSRFLRP